MKREFYRETMQRYADLPLREMVLATLRQAILTGELMPGERLMELHLSDELGVSRTPVREAIRNLEIEGLATMIPRRGAYVAKVSEKDVRDVLEVRRALEGLSVSRGTQRITPEGIADLKAAMLEFEKCCAGDNKTAIARADVHFHEIILKATGNDKLIAIMNNLSDQLFRYRFEYVRNEENYPHIVSEHRDIFAAIERRDEDAAVKLIQHHIDHQAACIVAALGGDE